MPGIRLQVGASADRSLAAVFQGIEASAKRASRVIGTEAERAAKKQADEAARAAKKQASEAERSAKKQIVEAEKVTKAQQREAEKAARAKIRENEKAARAAEREAEKVARAEAREAAKAARAKVQAEKEAAREIERQQARVRREIYRANNRAEHTQKSESGAGMGRGIGTARSVLGAATSILGSVARGAGVETDFGSHMQREAQLETAAVQLSNSGYIAGDARNGRRVSAAELTAQAREVGSATGYGANEVIEGLGKFTAKTGDLATGREVLKDLAVLSKATGTNLEDMVDAAGDVASNLGDIPNKAQAVNRTMRAIAGQGKVGAVEMKDFASQMAKVASTAPQFSGSVEDNIALFGALAQETRQRGGAASATQAATSVTSFANTFTKGARLDKFAKYGIATTGKDGKIRNPQELILEALKATKGDTRKMGELFADVRARSVTKGFESIYREKGGGQAGLEAVNAEFERLKHASMDQTEISESFARAMATSESRAQIFNNQMQAAAGTIKDAAIPALKGLSDIAVPLATQFAGLLAQATGVTEEAQQKAAASGTLDTVNAVQNAQADIRSKLVVGKNGLEFGGEVTPEHRAALQAARANNQKQMADRQKSQRGGALGALARDVEGMMPDWMKRYAKAGKTIEALAGSAEGERELARLRDDSKKMDQLLDLMKKQNTLMESGAPKGGAAPPAAPDGPAMRSHPEPVVVKKPGA